MKPFPNSFLRMQKLSQNIAALHAIHNVLEWDQETYMPKDGIESRSLQLEILAGMIHKQKTSKAYASTLSELIDISSGTLRDPSLQPPFQAACKAWRRDYLQAKKIPNAWVKKFAKTTSAALHAWSQAKKNSSFKEFAPHLQKIIDLSRKKADLLSFEEHPYDALVDLFEPAMTTATLSSLFSSLKQPLIQLLKDIQTTKPPREDFLYQYYPFNEQLQFGQKLLSSMGFSPDSSRLDLSSHPFCTGIHPKDTRLTTRIDTHHLTSNIFSVIHEGGHGLYNKNLPLEFYGTPLCEQISLGMDESQSRFWETRIGRSLPFWKYFYPLLQKEFPSQLSKISLEDFYRALNIVKPSLIRVEADEVTYCLHVILRFEIEKELIMGSLQVKDLPDVWNQKMDELLGIRPANDAEGCLQDIHWSMGAIGYFPTYALGNLYAAQFFETFETSHPTWEQEVSLGNLSFIESWLKQEIHQHGKAYNSQELIQKITGKPLQVTPFLQYLQSKYSQLYCL